MGEFDVTYAIADDEWRVIASGGPGLEGEPAFNYLKGDVVLLNNGQNPWTHAFHVSVADLALQFHQAHESGFPSRNSEALVSETDGGLDLYLKRIGDVIEMHVPSSPVRPRVETATYICGVERFLRSFVRELHARAPGALLADELAVLGRWL
jgi:hypothetical protein